jgi:UDP-N-acetyl-D-mannosaminuronic acid transferase (WecB/TagA/CpsF family)
MSRFLLAALVSGATCIGLVTTAHATAKLAATIATPAPAVVTVANHCGRGHHWVPRYRHNGHWVGDYCARNR